MQSTIHYLLEVGYSVRGVDSFFRYGKVEKTRDYEFVEGDLCDIGVAKKACEGVDVIIQAAARIFGVGGFHKYPADILSKDVTLHQNILWEALRNDVQKVVYTSSSMIYERVAKVPYEEDDIDGAPAPSTDYGLSKLVGERLCKAFYKQYGLKYTIWRPFNIITPQEKGEDEPGISHVFADFIKKIITDRQNPMDILGDGKQIRCFTWIGDIASAIAKYSFKSVTDCEVFNIGNPAPTTMRELALKIYAIAQKEGLIQNKSELTFRHLPSYEYDVKIRIPSIDKIKTMLGWQSEVELDEALHRCIDSVTELKGD